MELEYTDLNLRVYNILKSMIYNRDFIGGEKINLTQLSKDMNISISPIKQAVSRLESDGLVTVQPRKGTYVTELRAKDISDTMEIRLMMEQWIISNFTKQDAYETAKELKKITEKSKKIFDLEEFDFDSFMKYDIEFHNLIIDKYGNEKMTRFHSLMNIQFQITRVYYFKAYNRPVPTQEEHELIVNALSNYEIDRALELIKAHLKKSEKKMVSVLNENGGVL